MFLYNIVPYKNDDRLTKEYEISEKKGRKA